MTVSKIASQVMWNRLISVVEEQAQALVRTAFSTSVREAGDLSAGVYNADGAMLAQAVTGTPGHVNAMADAVPHFIRRIGRENICEGDVYITNDPWEGTGHLHDITVCSPSFHRSALVGFFACTAHIVDIGGRGFGADANSVYEEGLYIPTMKLVDRGTVDATLSAISVRVSGELTVSAERSADNDKITTNYAIDAQTRHLSIMGSLEGTRPEVSPNTGLMRSVGPLAIDGFDDAAFDIADTNNRAYLATRRGTDRATRLYEVDLKSGQARFIGGVGQGVVLRGLAIEP